MISFIKEIVCDIILKNEVISNVKKDDGGEETVREIKE